LGDRLAVEYNGPQRLRGQRCPCGRRALCEPRRAGHPASLGQAVIIHTYVDTAKIAAALDFMAASGLEEAEAPQICE
jgi:hypothetical protein